MGKKRQRNEEMQSKDGDGSRGKPKLSKLQQKMSRSLSGAQFRSLNQELYTQPSATSFAKFVAEPKLFDIYHCGFREQVAKWPINPLNVIVKWIKEKHPNAIVADFGCGEAELSASILNKCFSFDLSSGGNDRIIACDMAHVPLPDLSVDIVVFCLSLMGTNLMDFVAEAWRVLQHRGRMKVAEVRSRFEGKESGGGGGLKSFLCAMSQAGFDCRRCEKSNKMFVMIEFRKSSRKPDPNAMFKAKPCVYKRR
eukprot:313749_1